MAGKTTDWRPGPTVCRCCLTEGCYKDISTEYFWMGKREVYAEMLSDTFNVSISYSQSGPNSASRLICEPCISRLRDASDFKRQVQDCEKTFMTHLDPSASKPGSVQIEVESLDDVKMERVKVEKDESDDDDFAAPDFGDDDDDDDDLDNEPLTKLASKVPKKESVDLLDMLDTSQITVKRKSSSKTKEPPKKVKKKEVVVKPTTSKAKAKATAAAEKKKKEKGETSNNAATSMWELTIAERKNAANFIAFTTAIPLFFGNSLTHKCFYCKQQFSDIEKALAHTKTHDVPNNEEIFKKYLPKGRRIVKADISELSCRLCNEKFSDLDVIRRHLIKEHNKVFTPSGNGIIGYKLAIKNGKFHCHVCSKAYVTFYAFNRHAKEHFTNAVCDICGAIFLTYSRLKTHKEIHRPGGFPCQTCGNIYKTESYLKLHIEKAHLGIKKRKLKCRLCFEKFDEHFRKLKHLKDVHGVTFNFDCESCTATFSSRRAWKRHQNRFHSDKTKCEQCKRTFDSPNALKLHLISHTGDRNHVCKMCSKSYKYSRGLRRHEATHFKDKEIEFD